MLISCFCNGDASDDSQDYATRFQKTSFKSGICRTLYRLKETGSTVKKRSGGTRQQHNIQVEENIVDLVLDNPSIRIHRVCKCAGGSLKKRRRPSTKIEIDPPLSFTGQALLPEDRPRRLRFCHWILYQMEDKNFLSTIVGLTKHALHKRK